MIKNTLPLLLCGLISLISCQKRENARITIATAANMQFAMKALVAAFESEQSIACDVVVSSSGKLTAQIREGAPYDILVSADMKYPKILFGDGLTIDTPKVYAYGKLVLWTMDSNSPRPSFELLTSAKINHVALANPKTAPYGQAALEAMQAHKVLDRVEDKLVFGESIAQTNQFVVTQSAEVGFTAMSVVMSPAMLGKGQWIEVDSLDYVPIAQGVAMLKNTEGNDAHVRQFYEFLFSEKGQEILQNFGYRLAD